MTSFLHEGSFSFASRRIALALALNAPRSCEANRLYSSKRVATLKHRQPSSVSLSHRACSARSSSRRAVKRLHFPCATASEDTVLSAAVPGVTVSVPAPCTASTLATKFSSSIR